MKKGKGMTFRKGFLFYLAALALLFLAVLAMLWAVLARYQANRDAEALAKAESRAPQEAFEAFVAASTPEYWAQQWLDAHPESYDVKEKVVGEMTRRFGAESLCLWKAESYTVDAPVYTVKDGETKIADVAMSGSGLSWHADTVTMYMDGASAASVIAPADCTVLCNGVPLGADSAQPEKTLYDMKGYEGSVSGEISWLRYTVSRQLFEPEFTVEAPAGRTLSQLEERYTYVLAGAEAEELRARGERLALSVATYYMQGGPYAGSNMSRALTQVKKGSQAYEMIFGAWNGVSWSPFYGNASYDIHAGEVVVLADNCLALDIPFHAEGGAKGYRNISDGIYRVYFVDSGVGYEISSLFLM